MGGTVKCNGGGWVIDYGVEPEPLTMNFIWPPHAVDDPDVRSLVAGFNLQRKEVSNTDGSSSRKRNRVESCAEPGTKASREKLRRDKLNDRFFELASILDATKSPTPDKAVILSDATRRINQLHLEVQMLKDSNDALREGIKGIKEEKVRLRDEKVRLKAEKERVEHILKGMNTPPPFITYHSAMTYPSAPTFTDLGKTVSRPNRPPVAMWQWITPAVLDTSEDHVLRPPVA